MTFHRRVQNTSRLITVPDESPCLPVNTNGEEFIKQHREFNTVEGLLEVEQAHVHSRLLTDIRGDELLGCSARFYPDVLHDCEIKSGRRPGDKDACM